MTRFLLIRHAMTDSIGKRIAGRKPGIHLNAEGLLQAEQLARRLSGLSINAIYSSPLERAVETAIPLAKTLGLEIAVSNDFLEIEFGDWTDHSIDEIKANQSFYYFNSFRSSTRIPGGELMAEAQLRMIKGLEKLRLVHQNQNVIVVSHADMIKATVAYFAGIHLDMFQRIEISPASVTIIEIYDETARILLVNDTGNLKNLFHK